MTTTHHDRTGVRTARPRPVRRSSTTTKRRSHDDGGKAKATSGRKRSQASGDKGGKALPRVQKQSRRGDNSSSKGWSGKRVRAFGSLFRTGVTGRSSSRPGSAGPGGDRAAGVGRERETGPETGRAASGMSVAVPDSTKPVNVTDGSSALGTRHSAEGPDAGPNVRPRRRAREETELSSPIVATERSRGARFFLAIGREIKPMDFWKKPQPSLREVVAYAWQAPYAPDTGFGRFFGRVYGLGIALPYTSWLWFRGWIVARPGRLFVAFLLAVLLTLAGPGAWALGIYADSLLWALAQLNHLTGRT